LARHHEPPSGFPNAKSNSMGSSLPVTVACVWRAVMVELCFTSGTSAEKSHLSYLNNAYFELIVSRI
jgi:hypothetical protein